MSLLEGGPLVPIPVAAGHLTLQTHPQDLIQARNALRDHLVYEQLFPCVNSSTSTCAMVSPGRAWWFEHARQKLVGDERLPDVVLTWLKATNLR